MFSYTGDNCHRRPLALIIRYPVWIWAWHTQDTQDRVLPLQAAPKVQLSTSEPQWSNHWFNLLTYSSIDIDTLCQCSLTEWILVSLNRLIVSRHFKVFSLVFMEIFSSNSIAALLSFRWRLHFSPLICILRVGSHWKDQGNLCVANAVSLPGRLCRFH